MTRTSGESDWISGVRIKDMVIGTGREVRQGTCALANVRMFLRKGDELVGMETCGPRTLIELGKRKKNLGKHKCIPGLRYGIVGMREKGTRHLIISPHLAFGSEGFPDRVPPNAVIHCFVELLEVIDIQQQVDLEMVQAKAV